MANIYKSNYTGEQIDNSVGLTQENTATQGQVLTANGTGGASWQDASVGTKVVANPTLSGSETTLTGLEVSGTKYKVPTGGSGVNLYVHSIKFLYGGSPSNFSDYYRILLITKSAERYTTNSLITALLQGGFTSSYLAYPCFLTGSGTGQNVGSGVGASTQIVHNSIYSTGDSLIIPEIGFYPNGYSSSSPNTFIRCGAQNRTITIEEDTVLPII